jgi:hypothetical protein
MSGSFAQSVKRSLPAPLLGAARTTWNALQLLPGWPEANFHPWRRESIQRLKSYKDIHKGERCFIIGNGPSLKNTDLTKLVREYTFGMNRFYMAFADLGFTTTYYLSVNDLVVEQCAEDIRGLPIPKFLSWHSHGHIQPTHNTQYLYTTYQSPKFARDASGRLWEGATVTYVALQLAYHMGFRQAILIGVDHNFTTQGTPNTTVVSQGDDPNHFHPGYFGKGFRWQLPDLETSERAYRMARDAYARDGREVLDATVGGKLTVFPKVPYGSLFKS